MGQPFTYHQVQTDSDEEITSRIERTGPAHDRCSWATLLTLLLVIATLNIIAISKLWTLDKTISDSKRSTALNTTIVSPPDKPEVITNCGKSRAEAVSRGCILDIMAGAWLPKVCYDEELALEALSNSTELAKLGGAGPLPWWKDHNHTLPIAADLLQDLDELVANTWETFHSAHCH
ncbi:hypothetical protein FQN49_000280 [Arthroderma sp. PD_2]|nr:hypothetical protein FQN49_000280 [Arthroderma sp. PD_2]